LSLHLGFSLLTLFPDRVGGTETYVRSLLKEFVRGNGPERVTVLVNRHVEQAYRGEDGGPVSIHHVRSYRAGDSNATRALAITTAWALPRRVARDVPPGLDVIHFPVTVPIPRPRVPAVVTVHEIMHHVLPHTLSRAEREYRRIAYDGSMRAAAVVVVNNHHLKASLVERVRLAPERIEVIYPGVNQDRFGAEPGDDDARLAGLDLPERFVVYPANIWPHKNHERLIDALAQVPDRELTLVMTGQTYGRLPELLGRARKLGIERRVRHLGFVPQELVPPLYRRARAMVFPSLYENIPSPPLEAMACGCPVACSVRGSMGEAFGDAVAPIEPEDVEGIAATLDRVCTDEELREQLRAAGLTLVKRFRWETAAERHGAVYDRAAAWIGSDPGRRQ